ncbi:hypothetical protein T11_13817 [Trichinella zimbabwensis]|uniref:Uncharacterized protein n=1 Tax=Trichinella zimbabwensis TaxID=268475 RepID=A0A0V1I5B0_9BILA|nr:hypothetical protein T11_13817 [Trichinella zimbabwensis]
MNPGTMPTGDHTSDPLLRTLPASDQHILNVKLSQLPRYKDALSVQKDKLAQCEQQACSSATQRIEQSIETGQDTFGAYTAYSDCMNPCLAQRVRVQESSESSEE